MFVHEEEVTTIDGWTASVTIDLKEVESGEEAEEELYTQRSKLYRFVESEWKERDVETLIAFERWCVLSST